MRRLLKLVLAPLAAIFALAGVSKLLLSPELVSDFERYGYGTLFMIGVGMIEVLAAIGFASGYWRWSVARLAGAAALIVVTGACVTHLVQGEAAEAGFPLVLGVLAILIAASPRPLWQPRAS
jgi:hypothetical protein